MHLPALAVRACLQRTVQIGTRATGHEQRCIHMAQLSVRLLQWLCQPWPYNGADIGRQGAAGILPFSLCGARLRGNVQAGSFCGKGAFDRSIGLNIKQLVGLAGQGGLDSTFERGLQLHGSRCLQLRFSLVKAAGVAQAADLHVVVAAGIAVVAVQFGNDGFGRAFPHQAFNAQRHINAHR